MNADLHTGRSPWFTQRNLQCIPSPNTPRAPSPLLCCPPSVMGFQDHFASVGLAVAHGVCANLRQAVNPGLDFALHPQARRNVRPNRVRKTATDCMFASGCSPPHLAVTQLPSATGNGHLPEEDFHLLDRACFQAHECRITSGNLKHSRKTI